MREYGERFIVCVCVCVCGKKMFVVCITNPTHSSHITFKMELRPLTSADRGYTPYSNGGSRRGGRRTRRSRLGGGVHPLIFSDYRIKDEIRPLDEKYSVDKLRPVSYRNKATKKREIGLIAHELQEIYPSLVNGKKDGAEMQSVNYIGLIPILINEVKNLKKRMKKSA